MAETYWVGLPCDRKQVGHHYFHMAGEKYLRALREAADAVPILLPSLEPPLALETILPRLDGLFLTGAYSNIEPHHYSDEPSYPGNLHDPARDATTLSIVKQAVDLKIPVLAVCRGLQEVNVSLGGTLYQKVHEVDGLEDHREDNNDPLDVQYAPSHTVHLAEGGILRRVAGADSAMVNSLHGQGIRRMASGLTVEATAPDGLIEAVRLQSDDSFLLAVQWHPEWKFWDSPFYTGIFQAFAEAMAKRRATRKS